MFVLTALVYPCLLAALCIGAGLAVDRLSGSFLPAALLPSVGAAALIAVSQLTTYAAPLARATPYVIAVVSMGGFALGRARARALAGRLAARPLKLALPVGVYALALAPVLLSGRATFSSFMALADSAVHMMGADYLVRHGQDYAHLDLRNSYGQFVNDYYNTSYPSGADTLFGGSAFLLGLPLTWAFQPFNAFILAIASGPAWRLVRRAGLGGAVAALAALSVTVPALVYGYEIVGSVKELTALCMALTLGALVVLHRRWVRGPPARGVPFALVVAAGTSALGVGFGAWALAASAVLLAVAIGDLRAARASTAGLAALVVGGAAVTFLAALPTWIDVSGSLHVAQTIAATSNPGNLHTPLKAIQVFGTWLRGSYKQAPSGSALTITYVLIALAAAAAALGAAHLLWTRRFAFAGWIVAMLVAWLGLSVYATTWVDAKTLMITSPAVVLLAWCGVAALRSSPRPVLALGAAPLVALALAGGALASDAAQYHAANLAPTTRYEELASINRRFAHRGPTLFTDFDEYALYELRDLDIGGPDFVYPPPALSGVAAGYGARVDLDRASPQALASYPLIVTRRDPAASRPPAAYRLAWRGTFYEVWKRVAGAAPAIYHRPLSGGPSSQCRQIGVLASAARSGAPGASATAARRSGASAGASIFVAEAPQIVGVSLASARHPADWGHEREGLVMSRPGRLEAEFDVRSDGVWDVWLQGQFMPTVKVSLDGAPLASIAGELSGNSLVPNAVPPVAVRLAAGVHSLTVAPARSALAPGAGGAAVLDAIFLTPAPGAGVPALRSVPAARWQALCGGRYQWAELAVG